MWAEDDFEPSSDTWPRSYMEPRDANRYIMYHGTSRAAAQQIMANGFRQSSDGILGQGVYISRDLHKASRYPLELPEHERVVLKLRVNVGRVKKIDRQGHPMQKTWHTKHGYDTAWIPPNCGMLPSDLEEDCVWDPRRITVISAIYPEPDSSGGTKILHPSNQLSRLSSPELRPARSKALISTRPVPLPLRDPPTTRTSEQARFVESHRAEFIQRVTLVEPIADRLLQRKFINNEMYNVIISGRTSQDKMRKLFHALNTIESQEAFYLILEEQQPYLMEDLAVTFVDKHKDKLKKLLSSEPTAGNLDDETKAELYKKLQEEEPHLVQDLSVPDDVKIPYTPNTKILGRGASGTLVYEGTFQKRKVAVKRMLRDYSKFALTEAELLLRLDDHPHVIRYFANWVDNDFQYIILELCSSTLQTVSQPHTVRLHVDPCIISN
ncbi:hypothetical protein AGOR_G00030700 [Albula goreensis]|uniref:non-specific serine/threonine protein kinase n=1 Tax=Albula goreensis TaxID=1534307 RepID=A0A8T3E6A0_9TELE|nr:hypothetical protein AGOR_G00030700 [Albula goreensis]